MKKRMQLIAWVLFLLCGVIYLAAAIRDQDLLMIAGTVSFTLGVIVFLLSVQH